MGINSLLGLLGAVTFSQPWVMTVFFALLFTGLAAYSMVRPAAAVALYFAVSIMNPQASYPLFVDLPAAKIAAGICLFSCLINMRKLSVRLPLALLPMIAFLIMANISTWTALQPELADQRFQEFNKIGLMVLLTVWAITTRKDYVFLFWGIFGSLSYGVLKNLVETQTNGAWVTVHGAAGWIGDSNDWALALAMGLPLFYCALATQWHTGWKRRIFLGTATAGALLTLTLTSSRGGFLAMAGSGAVFLFMDRKPLRALAPAMAIALVAGLYMPGAYVHKIGTIFGLEDTAVAAWNDETPDDDEYTGAERVHYWRVASEVMLDHPLTGVGWGNFIEEFKRREDLKEGVVAHSTWFQVGAESGIPGLSFYALMVLTTLAGSLRTWFTARRTNDCWAEQHSRAILAGTTAFVIGATFISRENSELFFIYIAMSAVLAALVQKKDQQDTNAPVRTDRPGAGRATSPGEGCSSNASEPGWRAVRPWQTTGQEHQERSGHA